MLWPQRLRLPCSERHLLRCVPRRSAQLALSTACDTSRHEGAYLLPLSGSTNRIRGKRTDFTQVWTWGSAPIELCPFHVDMRLPLALHAVRVKEGLPMCVSLTQGAQRRFLSFWKTCLVGHMAPQIEVPLFHRDLFGLWDALLSCDACLHAAFL